MKTILSLLTIISLINMPTGIEKARNKTERLIKKELKKENVHNVFLYVFSPSHKIDWNFTVGNSKGAQVSKDTPFYTASIGKTFTATAIAVLEEQGKLSFNDKINKYLSEEIMDGLHVLEGTEYSNDITVSQLLQHTSGLPDYFEGETIDGSPNVMELIFNDMTRFWNPLETIMFTKEKMIPLFAPGTDYHYSDTEYVLLGFIVEKLSEMPLENFFISNFFEPLNMRNTSMNLRSEPLSKTPQSADFYVGDFESGNMKSLSSDWAGGGLLSTTSDLVKFQLALNKGEIVSEKTLEKMQNWTHETKGMYYGYGLRKIVFQELFPGLPKLEIIGHSGSTASFMYYCPSLDVYLAGSLNQTEEVKNSVILMVKVLSILNKELN